jgi:Uma2 family endonuclease
MGLETHRPNPRDMLSTVPATVSTSTQPFRPRRFSVREYIAMGESGILRAEDRVELIDGQVISMSPIGNWHSASVTRLSRLIQEQLRDPMELVVQGAINVGDDTQLMPDLAIVEAESSVWENGFRGTDCLLVIEVAHSSLATDRTTKKAIYASTGIQEYWIVDLAGRRMEVFRKPEAGDYRQRKVYEKKASVSSKAVAGLAVMVEEVVPPDDDG